MITSSFQILNVLILLAGPILIGAGLYWYSRLKKNTDGAVKASALTLVGLGVLVSLLAAYYWFVV